MLFGYVWGAAALACIFLSGPLYCQDDVVRIETNLVTIPVTVSDRSGRYVTDIKERDFQIFEDGVEQEVALFETVDQPFTAFLLLDVSGSMSIHLPTLAQAANSFVGQLRKNDRIVVGVFADNLHILVKPTDVDALERNIRLQQRRNEHFSRIYDAVHDTLKMIKKIRGRKAIILFSDGAGDGTFGSLKENLRQAEEGESMIYTVQFNSFRRVPHPHVNTEHFQKRVEEANAYMRALSALSGGRSFRIDEITDLDSTFGAISAELRQQYSLGYYTKHPKSGSRQIRVKVNRPDVAVRARSSFVFGK